MGESTYHSSHPQHPLELQTFQNSYMCDGCKEPGFGKRYRCDLCDFDLHEDCMFFSCQTSHAFFPESTFEFFDQPPWAVCHEGKRPCNKCRRYCDACGKPIKGFVYHCRENDLELHPCCSNLKDKLRIDGTTFWLRKGVDSSCFWCRKVKVRDGVSEIGGWSYVSKCEEYHLHVYCVTEMVAKTWMNKDGVGNKEKCLDVENLEMPRDTSLADMRGNGRRGNKYWKVIRAIFRTIACILLGDPTIPVACLVIDLVT